MSEPIEPELHELERALRRLTPAPADVNRDELLFEAGRASMRVPFRLWRHVIAWCAAFALGVLILGLVYFASRQRSATEVARPQPPIRVIVPPHLPPAPQGAGALPGEVPEPPPLPPGSYWQIQEHLRRTGELPQTPLPPPGQPARAPEIPNAWSIHSPSPLMQSRFAEGDFE